MKCNDVNRLSEDYLSGLLSQSRSNDIEEHLANCPHCVQLLLVEDQEFDALLYSSWHLTSPSDGFANGVMQRVESSKKLSWLWLAAVGLSYTSLWLLGIVLVLLRQNVTVVMAQVSHMVSFARSMSRVLVLIVEAAQLYSISTTGLIVVF